MARGQLGAAQRRRNFSVPFLLHVLPPLDVLMAELDQLLSQLWAGVASRGTNWLQDQVAALMGEQDTGSVTGGQGLTHAWSSWPLERFSLDPSPRAQRHLGRPN